MQKFLNNIAIVITILLGLGFSNCYATIITDTSGDLVTDSNNYPVTDTSGPALMDVSITTQPVDATVSTTAKAIFSVVATGYPTPTYQWLQETPDASTFTPISGATSASYTTPPTTTANSSTEFECIVTNALGHVTSNVVALFVSGAPSIITQPVSVSVNAPVAATFNLLAAGIPSPTYQWLQKAPGASLFTAISGATNASYTTAATTTANSGTQYECLISNSMGSVTSNIVVMTVNPATTVTITAGFGTGGVIEPNGSVIVNYGASQTFTLTASKGYNIANLTVDGSAVTLTNNAYTLSDVIITHALKANFVLQSPAASITTQPVSMTVTAPATATFSVVATGTPAPTYQWQQEASGATTYTVISGATSTSYTTPATTTANSGTKYECVVTNTGASVTSSAATLTVNPTPVAPIITTQPVSATVTTPATATFSVVATGTPTPTYQWQQEASGATTYTVISGATSASYTTPATTAANSGTKYECVVTNTGASVTSSAATLTVNPTPVAPTITSQPLNATVTAPATATFTVTVTGIPTPTYQWQQEASGATTYTAISGAISASYTTPATTTANSGTKYECVVTNTGGSVTSSAATLTVIAAPTGEIIANTNTSKVAITGTWYASTSTGGYYGTDYIDDGDTLEGTKSVKYTPILSGGPGSYQVFIWYPAYSNRATNVPVDIIHSGTTTTVIVNQQTNGGSWFSLGTYSFLANGSGEGVNIRTTAANGYVIANAVEFTQLVASAGPTITSQPVNATVTTPATATFTVTATGTPTPTYQWQQEASGATTYITISGATNASYTTVATTTANSGTKYECVVTNSAGSVTSNAATLTVNPTPVVPTITSQPANATVTAPTTATFSVVASGTPTPTYQWQQEASGATTYTAISGATNASYTTPATTTANSGTKYECVVTNWAGSVTSNAATLTVNAGATYIQNIQYNANGQITQIQYGNGVTTAYTYNPLNFRLIRIYTSDSQAQVIQDLNYTYDSIGQVLSITDNVNIGNNSMNQTFAYDALNRLTNAQGSYGTKVYAYDQLGNVTQKDGLTYNYGEANSQVNSSGTVIGNAGPHAVTSLSDGSVFKYDANGNMVSLTKGSNSTQYAYDSQNRLQGVSVGGLSVASYAYDGDGGRIQKTVSRRDLALYNNNTNPLLFGNLDAPLPATAQNLAVDNTIYVGNVYETENAPGSISRNTKFIFMGDSRVASQDSSGNIYYYHTDHLGGTNVLTDQTGEVREFTDYDPFGLVFSHEKYGNDFATAWYYFTGKPLDDETGLIYLGARYYNPSLGRFITPDTVVQAPGNPQTLNRYTYCNNNPVNLIDPSGHSWFSKFFHNLFKDLKAIVQTVLAAVEIVVGVVTANPFLVASGTLSLINNGTSSWQGGGWNTFHQVVGYTAIALAVVGTFESFTAGASGGEGLESGDEDVLEPGAADATSGGSAAASGSGVAANAPYYQTGDLVKAFNNIEADVFDKVAYAGQIMNQASESASLAVDAQGLQDTWSPFDFMGGAVSGGKALVSAGLNAGDNAVFYTGGEIAKEQAMAFAEQVGGRTILDTPIGQVLETFKAPDFVWQSASRVFAESATGEADVFIGEGASWSRTYGSIEADILDKNGVDVTIHDAV